MSQSHFEKANLLMRWRLMKDLIARHAVGIGGIGVIIAIILIFIYLVYVVLPLFHAADIEKVAEYPVQSAATGKTLLLAMEEQTEVALRLTDRATVQFINTHDGSLNREIALPRPPQATVTALATATPNSGVMALGFSNGQALVFKHNYRITFPDDKRLITPVIEYPLGEKPLLLDRDKKSLLKLAVQLDEEKSTLAYVTEDGRIQLAQFIKEESMLDDEVTWERVEASVPHPANPVTHLLIDKDQRNLFIASGLADLSYYDISDIEEPTLVQHLPLFTHGEKLSVLTFLTGDISLMAGANDGTVSQWFPVAEEGGKRLLKKIREFSELTANVSAIAPEYNRKGFIAADDAGQLGIFHTTAHRTLLSKQITLKSIQHTAISPRANAMLLESNDLLYFYKIHNEHPEVSWSSLWGKVWYESYDEPDYIWQSSSASNDFEPKLSLVPISFGTIKAAFYAMLLAVPLSVMGAIFTAHFMAPKMRQVVKPTIEIMEALPTVILGFLAGLWLAPFMEDHLPGIFSLLLLMPFGILLSAYIYHRLPSHIRHAVPEGWEAALLIPLVLVLGYACFAVSPVIEDGLFGGDIRIWLSDNLGINYDQRNSLVVGLAMGFAVIPTIFSITEDAIFAVPKHLVQGSLALGATSWQTMMRVVLLTASPGIFSAVMIGMGRAVGETMIVLMATGNTPVMDFNIFEGMRTLSANIAVEMPESEVDSTHYRVLFLAALVLFGFTFVFNTAAEIVRQRLRKRYSSL